MDVLVERAQFEADRQLSLASLADQAIKHRPIGQVSRTVCTAKRDRVKAEDHSQLLVLQDNGGVLVW